MSNVSVYTNEYESSVSVDNQIVHKVRQGSSSMERFEKTSDSLSRTTASFRIPVSENLLLSRRLVLEVPITYTVATNANTVNIANLQAVPRSDCLNRLITNCNVKINGSSFTTNCSLFAASVQFYSKDSKSLTNGAVLALSPNTPDLKFADNLAKPGVEGEFDTRVATANSGNLAGYHFQKESYSQLWPSRATMPFSEVTAANTDGSGGVVQSTVTGVTGPSYVSLTYVVRYVLKNPILSHSPYECLTSVQDMQVDVTFDNANILQTLFFRHKIGGHDGTSPVADLLSPTNFISVETASISQDPTAVKLIGFTVSPSMSEKIPETIVCPAQEMLIYDYSLGAINAGVTKSNNIHTAIHVQMIPSSILLQVIPEDSSRTVSRSDYFALMSNIQIVVNNRTYSFQNYSQQDWYSLCSNNGYKGRFEHFDCSTKVLLNSQGGRTPAIGVGSPLLLIPSRDLGSSLPEGVVMPFKMEVRFNVQNTTLVNMNFLSRVILVMDQKIRITKGMPCTIENGITLQDYSAALASGQVFGTSEDMEADYDEPLGGGRAISSYFRDASRYALKGLDVTAKLLNSANELFPEANLGRTADLVNRGNMLATQSGLRAAVGSGMLGGCGGSRYEQLKGMGILK